MRLPRDLSGRDLVKALSHLDYVITRETGSHIRLSTTNNGKHNITILNHDFLKVGSLSAILREIADYFNLTRKELIKQLKL